MPVSDWIDVGELPFETLLLLEDPHLRWCPRDWPGNELGVALRHHPGVGVFLRVRSRAGLERITRTGGTVVPGPGGSDVDGDGHRALLAAGYAWSVFEEPDDGPKRKYWRTVGDGPRATLRAQG